MQVNCNLKDYLEENGECDSITASHSCKVMTPNVTRHVAIGGRKMSHAVNTMVA